MFSFKKHRFFVLLFRVCLLIFLLRQACMLTAQTDQDLIVLADRHFQEENYPEAMRLYSQLLSLHRNDPLYSYRFGVSKLYSDRSDPNATIKYIEAGYGKLTGDDAILLNFHLATAYHLTFRFIEAMRYYGYFKDQAHNKKFLSYDVDRRIEMCRNGMMLLQNIRDLYVFEKHHVSSESFFRSYNISRFGGKLLVKPDIFKTKFDKKQGETTIIFLSDTQNVVYYSSYGRDGSSGKDIYRSFKIGSGWTSPERLSNVINTEYDEDYPFILPDGKTLYFCSKGHNSMGGYDVFRSVWDKEKDNWSEPVNLDFAVNTPFDDILFVTDKEEKYAYFSSVRGSGLEQINVFLVRIDIRPEDTSEELLAVVTDLTADVTDSVYIEAVHKIQQISNLDVNASKEEFDKRDEERRKQLYADNYKYNISENPTDEELINLTFQYAGDAERSFLNLRQKREAAELSAERYKDRANKYTAEADRLYDQALTETEAVKKRQLSEQATEMRMKAAEADMQYKKTNELVRELTKSIEFQSSEYNKILLRAGEIQRLASGRQIDTSVVLLKQLIDDIKVYEMNIQDFIAETFPSYEILEYYDAEISDAIEKIDSFNNALRELEAELELYDNELLLVKDSERKNDLLKEMEVTQNSVAELTATKQDLENRVIDLEQSRKTASSMIESSEYSVLADVILVEELMVSNPDSLNMLISNSDLPTENFIAENNGDSVVNNTSTDTVNTTVLNNTVAENTITNENTTTDTFHTTHIPNNTDLVINTNDTDTQYAWNVTDPTDTTDIADTLNNTVNDTALVNNTLLTDTATTNPVNNTLTDRTDIVAVESVNETKYALIDRDKKSAALKTIMESEESTEFKTHEILRFLDEEKAFLRIQKQTVNNDIAKIVKGIESTESQLTEINTRLSEPDISAFDRRMLETEWNRLMNNYADDLKQLDKLLMVSEMIDAQIQQTDDVAAQVETSSEEIFTLISQGNENRALTEFRKMTAYLVYQSERIFTYPESVSLIVQKNIEAIREQKQRQETKAQNAENKAVQFENKAADATEKAQNAKNPEKQQEYFDVALTCSEQAEIYRDSAASYRKEAESLQLNADALRDSEKDIIRYAESLGNVAPEEMNNTYSMTETTPDARKIDRMEMLIAENPWAENFFERVSLSGQWFASPDIADDSAVALVFVSPPVNDNRMEIDAADTTVQNSEQLREIADKAQAWILKSSAAIYITRIQQIDQDIDTVTDPVRTLQLYNERERLQTELTEVMSDYHTIALQYDDLDSLSPESLPLWDELSVDPELSVEAMNAYMESVRRSIDSLNLMLTQEQNEQARKKFSEDISRLKTEIRICELKIVEIIARADMSQLTLQSVVIRSLPMAQIDAPLLKEFSRLDSLRNVYEANASMAMDEAGDLQTLEQKRALYVEAWENTEKALEIQNQMLDMYMKYADPRTDLNAIAGNLITESVKNTEKSRNLMAFAGKSANMYDSSAVVMNTATSDTTDRTDIGEPVNNSTIVTDRTSENYVAYYSDTNPVPEHTAPGGRLLFRVQFAASRRAAANNAYKGMNPIYYEQSGGWYRYMHGEFYDLNAATTARNQVRTMGFADAFVVAYYNGKRITIAEARNIMAAQPGITYASAGIPDGETTAATTTAVENMTENIQFDSVEGFYFAVQVGVYGKPRTSQQLFGITPLIEERLANGNYRYMTGTYTSLEEANASRDRIRANGVPDAFVVVYRNGERILVREAQDLINAGQQPASNISLLGNTSRPAVQADRSVRAANTVFSVQIGAFSHPVPDEVMNAFRQLSSDEVFSIQGENGLVIYTTGRFKTPDEAELLKTQLQQSGIPDTFVIAIEGTTKISLQEAKELLQIP